MNIPINGISNFTESMGAAAEREAIAEYPFWTPHKRRRGCIVCEEARWLCKRHEYCYYDDDDTSCNYCKNHEIHHLLRFNSNKECICDCKGLELLLEKKKVIEEKKNIVYWLYLMRKNCEEENRNGEKYRYGFLEPNFICMMFGKYTEGVKEEIPPDYITDWPWEWFYKEEDEYYKKIRMYAVRGFDTH